MQSQSTRFDAAADPRPELVRMVCRCVSCRSTNSTEASRFSMGECLLDTDGHLRAPRGSGNVYMGHESREVCRSPSVLGHRPKTKRPRRHADRLCRPLVHCYRFRVSLGKVVQVRGLRESETSTTDAELVHALAKGKEDALAALYDRYADLLMAIALRMLGDVRDAEDLLHDVFVEVWRAARTYDSSRGSVRAWLVTRMRSRAVDRVRAKGRARVVLTDEGQAPDQASSRPDPSELSDYARIREVLTSLSPEQRRVLELGYFGGLSSAEIAEREGIPIGTVKSRVARGLAQLRQLLGGDPKGGPSK